MFTIRQWFEKLGLEEYTQTFEADKIDLEALSCLTEDDLKELGLPMGPRKKILAAISKGILQQPSLASDVKSFPSTVPPTSPAESSTSRADVLKTAAIEYGLIAAGVAVAMAALTVTLGDEIATTFQSVIDALSGGG